jgi:plastocyanin
MRARIAAVAAVAVALGTAGGATAFSSATTPTLKGVVGPGFTISLRDSKGKLVSTLKAGTYKFVLTDKADIHTFSLKQLKGGTFNKDLTSDTFQGTKTVKVKLTKGKWQYYCALHPTEMFGNFTVK